MPSIYILGLLLIFFLGCGTSEKEEFIIPITDIKKYDLVVNHCPNVKRTEFAPFY